MNTNKQLCSFLLGFVFLIFSPAKSQFVQQGSKLVGTGASGSASLGNSVAISADGNTAIVGGPNDNGLIGAAWIYIRTGGVWTQQGSKLVGTGATGNAQQGYFVSLSADGNTAIVGGPDDNNHLGAVWVYTRSGGVWSQQGGKLVGTGASGNSEQGRTVSISADGNTAIVGGPNDNSIAGAVWVYTRSGGVWTQQGSKLFGTGAVGIAEQGYSLSISADGNTAIVGGVVDSSYAGAAWVYTRSGGVWSQQGGKLVGTGAVGSADQGSSVSLSADGNTAIVCGYGDNGFIGATWVYTRTGGVWSQQGSKLVGTGAVGSAQQGTSASLSADGNTAIVGGGVDSSYAGAAWVYARTGGVWTQKGSKLVGTGAIGSVAQQGVSVSLSADGHTAIVGGPGDNSYAGAVWVYYNPASLVITSIRDIPNDQGGKVRINWIKSASDDSLSSPQVTSYSIFRKSSSGANMAAKESPVPKNILMDSSLLGYDYVASVPAFQLPNYQTVVPTLDDSDASGTHYFDFIVVAQTSDINQYYVSEVDSGYSVDNIPPIQPAGLLASVLSGPHVKLTWNSPSDPDVGSYSIYRSTTDGFTPSPGTLIGTVNSINFTDASPLSGDLAYYSIVAVDIHGNKSIPSAQAAAAITVSQQFNLQGSWNMVSVPLMVSDFSKTALYPTAISNAFAYAGSYVITSTLASGSGYWLKFSGSQSDNLTGLLLQNDTVNVMTGWNMIGSLSQPIAVSSVSSVPGGITTSRFFGYKGSYVTTDTIYPGKGYWIKVNQGGKLVLASSSQATPSTTIRIVPTDELPPSSPEASNENLRTIPASYALEQNYPNPFNPTTIINYALPLQAFVHLTVYNILGQEVATLVNEVQDAGSRSVEFNANNFPSGLYFYKVTAGTFTQMKRMVLLK